MIVYHEDFLKHRQDSPMHPEAPARLTAIQERLKQEGLWRDVSAPTAAPWEDLARVHQQTYLRRLEEFGGGYWDADTYILPTTFGIAKLSAGAAIRAAEWAWDEGRPALALTRPPGHHATASDAMGFCYLNNIAVAAARLVAQGRGPVAIVDIDVHHGNGTNDIFYADKRVLFISLHQWPLYPGTGMAQDVGEGVGRGFTVNVPLPAGSGDATYRMAFERLVEPVVEQFKPAIVLVSLGADAHARDPLAAMALSSAGYLEMIDRLGRLADKIAKGRLAVMLEGGYHLEALADVLAGTAGRLEQKKVALKYPESPDKDGRGAEAVEKAIKIQKEFWKL